MKYDFQVKQRIQQFMCIVDEKIPCYIDLDLKVVTFGQGNDNSLVSTNIVPTMNLQQDRMFSNNI